MISPELLRHFPFFGQLNDEQLSQVAMITSEIALAPGSSIFLENHAAESLYFLLEGSVDLYCKSQKVISGKGPEGIHVGGINSGEPFGISALIEPHMLTATAWASNPSRVLAMRVEDLIPLFKKDKRLAYLMTHQAAKAVINRLHATRVQLAAAWA